MITALLLPWSFAAAPTPVRAIAPHDDPPIQLWISNDRRFFPGDRVKVQVRAEDDGYLIVFHVDPEGYLRVLFPLDPGKDNFVRGGKKYEVKGRGGRDAFEADGKGRGTVYAAISREPFRLEGSVLGDHWDYRALAPERLTNNPEAELNDLVRRMAQGNFDYDLLGYDVVDRTAYAGRGPYVYRSWLYDDPWCYRFSCGSAYYGSPFSVSIVFGRPYRRYYYDPYYYAYDPFFNPFFYDPYYYSRVLYPHYVYPRRHYAYPYRDWYYRDRYRGHFRSYPPYRFRGAEGFADYRDRRYDLRRSINTVYNPPVSPVREPAVAKPIRRVVDDPGKGLPRDAAKRRLIDDAVRAQNRPVEARRARPEDPARVAPAEQPVRERSTGEPRLIRREVEARRSQETDDARQRPSTRRRDETGAERGQVERRAEPVRPQSRPEPVREAPRRTEPPAAGHSDARSSGGGSRPSQDGGRRRR